MTTLVPASVIDPTALSAKANDNAVVHLTGNETIAGTKTFSTQPVLPQARTQMAAVATTSGTSIDFTGIPSWAKRITIALNGVSTNGTSIPQIQIGPSAAVETTGYNATVSRNNNGVAPTVANATTGFYLDAAWAATLTASGIVTLVLLDATTNTWACSGVVGSAVVGLLGGSKSLAGTLARVRLTTANGTDTFDAGSVNVTYE